MRGGSGRVRVVGTEETSYREVSTDTMKLHLPVRRGVGDDEPVLGMKPNQIAARIGAAVRQTGCTTARDREATGRWPTIPMNSTIN